MSERGRFARICVELDLQKRLKSAINVFGRRCVIEYEGLHLICFCCGKYGHHRDLCPDRVVEEKVIQKSNNEKPNPLVSELELQGGKSDWHGGEEVTKEKEENYGAGNQKRPRGLEDEGVSSGGISSSPGERLGPQNLVKRLLRRNLGNLENQGKNEKNQESNSKGKMVVIKRRDARDSKFVGIKNTSQQDSFAFKAKDTDRKFGKEISNNSLWVPVVGKQNSRVKGKLVGKENKMIKYRPKTVGPSEVHGPGKSSMTLANSFEALHGDDTHEAGGDVMEDDNQEEALLKSRAMTQSFNRLGVGRELELEADTSREEKQGAREVEMVMENVPSDVLLGSQARPSNISFS